MALTYNTSLYTVEGNNVIMIIHEIYLKRCNIMSEKQVVHLCKNNKKYVSVHQTYIYICIGLKDGL